VTDYLREALDWSNVALVPAACAFAWACVLTGELHVGVIVGGLVWSGIVALFATETEEVQP
jgi:hypothetical protein